MHGRSGHEEVPLGCRGSRWVRGPDGRGDRAHDAAASRSVRTG
ncbi:hypothetical protein FM103_09920 [Corynebacterium xerosis]|nr:hypothetical protein FM103_09920 [Corynebacterium xerosis]